MTQLLIVRMSAGGVLDVGGIRFGTDTDTDNKD